MIIYSVGDSHCWHAWKNIPNVVVKTIGAMTMYRFGLSKQIIVSDIPQDAIVCFCWGEIDCRCHVHKHQPWKENIDGIVKEYLATIALNEITHKNIWIYNVVPPPRNNGKFFENPGFPFVGSDEDRLSYVKYMNQKLKESKYPFVDIYDKYADKDGFLRKDVSDEHVHVEDEKPLVEWINKRMGYE